LKNTCSLEFAKTFLSRKGLTMGKNITSQRRGRGSPRYRVPSHRFIGRASYSSIKGPQNGEITSIEHSPGKLAPFAMVEFGKRETYVKAVDGMQVGAQVMLKGLSSIAEGSKICNIELHPGDGGVLCKSAGAFATLISKEGNRAVILMPSKKKKILPVGCRALEGVIANSGRQEKPFLKAGTRHYAMKIRGKLYPITSGVAKNACNHPFGGQTRPGKPKSVSRHASPGRKVGSISPRRMGRKNK